MLKIGLLFKPELKDINQIIQLLTEIEKTELANFYILDKNEKFCHPQILCQFPNSAQFIDFILCFGGDGTMLRSTEFAISYNAPVLGINYGKLGFLSDCSLKELKNSLNDLINRKFHLESRMLLEVKVYRNNKLYTQAISLNDAVLFKGSDAKLVNFRLYANKQFVYETRSDGIVISTPTGATAYSLSAGGPIISPAMQAIIVTPLNPHILTVRPMVFDDNETIEIKLPSNNFLNLQIDGINKCELQCHDRIVLKKSKKFVNFVKLTQKTFYRILRRKLHMGKI